MLTKEGIASLRERLVAVREAGAQYFERAAPVQVDGGYEGHSWVIASPSDQVESEELRSTIKSLGVDIAGAARGSPMITEADLLDLRHNTRQMLANLRFNRYRHWGVRIHHNEDIVLGVDPPSQEESALSDYLSARGMFNTAAVAIRDLVDLLSPAETLQAGVAGTASYKPNTAFIMMAIDSTKPELQDVKNAIMDVFKEFGVQAVTSDDIEHDDAITDRILDEIDSSEFLLADMTYERPNVYYEVGHAHARNKRVMLYRKLGEKLHFDLAHRNCPEYANVTALKELLRKRLEVVTNRPKKP